MAQIGGAGQQDTDNQNAEALQAALAQRQVTLQGQPQSGSDVPIHQNSDPVSDESEILRSCQPLTGKRRVPWRPATCRRHSARSSLWLVAVAAHPSSRGQALSLATASTRSLCANSTVVLKPILRRVWAPKGQRPIALGHHRYKWLYV